MPPEDLKAFADARKQNTQTLRGLVAEQFHRQGTLEGVGSVTIRGLFLMMRDHDATTFVSCLPFASG
jgi:hypothetical protein